MTKLIGFTKNQEDEISKIIKPFIKYFNIIKLDPSLIKDIKYKVFGKYNTKNKILKINPKVFVVSFFKDPISNKKMSVLKYVLLHEVAHSIYKNLTKEQINKWYSISGWTKTPSESELYINLEIPKSGEKSEWYYKNDAKDSFPRWYAKFSPKEDFTDSFAFIYSGLLGRFGGKKGIEKINFIKSIPWN